MLSVPLLVDCHVHFREPGLEHKGDILSESIAAHAGGIRVVCEMPNTNPPTQTIDAFRDKVCRAQRAEKYCDVRFFFGATSMEHLEELQTLWTSPDHTALKQKCSGLKLYLDNSTGDMKSSTEVTEAAFRLCGELGIPLVAHCEHSETNDACCKEHPYTSAATHSDRRPPLSELRSIEFAIGLATKYRTKLHVAHLSTGPGLEAVKDAKAAGLPVTCEVCTHHLYLTTADYASNESRVKVNPPIRTLDHREALWSGLLEGHIDCIATDHAPHTMEEKRHSSNPPSGIPGVELVVPLMLTAVFGKWPHPVAPPPLTWSRKRLSMDDLVRMLHTNPNRIFNLGLSSEPVTTIDPAVEWVVQEEKLAGKCKWSPYHGWKLTGKVVN